MLETHRYMIAYYEAFKNKTRKKTTYVISCTSVVSSCFVINEILVFLRATIPIQCARHLHSCSYLCSALMCGLHFKNPVISISIWHSGSLSSYCSESLSSQVYTLTMCIPAQWNVRFCVLCVHESMWGMRGGVSVQVTSSQTNDKQHVTKRCPYNVANSKHAVFFYTISSLSGIPPR